MKKIEIKLVIIKSIKSMLCTSEAEMATTFFACDPAEDDYIDMEVNSADCKHSKELK